MVFSSVTFLFLFLPLTLLVYYIFPVTEIRNLMLLAASIIFYYCGAEKYISIILVSVCINYLTGLALAYIARSKLFLFAAITLNLGLLFYYKYADFVIEQYNSVTKSQIQLLGVVLPIGISFFTFQGLSYVFDLYAGKIGVQKNPLHIALYITMFPQLIAGPIVRYSDILCDLAERKHTLEKMADGICRFSIGLAKKVIMADTVGAVADRIFSVSYAEHAVLTCWIGLICYTYQILFDFMGYSDMAIGLGKMFGFDFPENFDLPYTSKSVQEFWRRWHMTLGGFFRDYVYIPLGGVRNMFTGIYGSFFF